MTPPSSAPVQSAPSSPSPCRRYLAALLLVSYALRVWLACLGGQGLWADEDRYTDGRLAARYMLHGRWHDAGQELFSHPDHILFRWFSVPPGLYEELAGSHSAVVAAYFGLFSVGVIYLIWQIARRAGASESEALWAAFMAACANTLFYYSRHFFPYDIALCAMLGGLALALGGASICNSLLVGIAAGLGFLVYNGYWLLGGSVLILYTLLGAGGWRRIWVRGVWSGLGLVLSMVPIVGVGRLFGIDLVGEDYKWGVIARGDFPFAHRVVAGYLWFGERGLLLLWLAALGYALLAPRGDRRPRRLWWYVGGLVLIVVGLVALSDIIPLFAVQGRRVRCAVPFLCLCAGYGIDRFVGRRERGRQVWVIPIAGLALVLAAFNFAQPLRQVFPAEFQRRAARIIRSKPGYGAYQLAFAEPLWGLPLDPVLPQSVPLLQSPHPLQFRPYQYEGYDTGQRAEINHHDVTMRLFRIPVALDQGHDLWAGYPGPVRWSVTFPTNREGLAEPLVTSGQTGRGDFLFVRYVDRHRVAFGLDHWGSGAAISAPVEIDYSKPHEVAISMGSLLPPSDSPFFQANPDRLPWRSQVLVLLDGQVVFRWPQEMWPASRDQITFGVNLIGGTAAQLSFSGRELGLDVERSGAIGRAMAGPVLGALIENSWARVPLASTPTAAAAKAVAEQEVAGRNEHMAGVRFQLPEAERQLAQPLLVLTRTDGAQGVLAIRRAARGVAIGWRDQAGWQWSRPLDVSAGGHQRVEMQWNRAAGTSAPPASDRARRAAAFIGVDGIVLAHPAPAFFDVPIMEVAGWRGTAAADPVLAAAFEGKIETPEVPQPLVLAHDGPPPSRHFRLAVRLPADRPGRSEPLLTAGHTGAADGLFVHYEGPGLIRLGFDHWGEGGPVTDPLPVTNAYQTIDVEFGRGSWTDSRGGDIKVRLNGHSVLSESAEFYSAPPAELTIGANRIGLSTSDPEFSGQLFLLEGKPDDGR